MFLARGRRLLAGCVCSNAMRVGRGNPAKLKLSCFAVGVCHLVLLGFSIYERVWELIKLEEPFIIRDHSVILTSYVAQLLSVFLLIFASVTGNSYYIIPWLVCTAPIFFTATIYALLYVSQEETSQMFLNFLVVVSPATVEMNLVSCLKDFLYSHSKEKIKIYLICLLHSVMVCFGLWSLVSDLLDSEDAVTTSDLVYIAIHYTVHFFLIFCLFLGAYIDIPVFLIPWLGATLLTYVYMTAFTLISLQSRTLRDTLLYSMNFFYLIVSWYTWYVVFSYLKSAYSKGKIWQYKLWTDLQRG